MAGDDAAVLDRATAQLRAALGGGQLRSIMAGVVSQAGPYHAQLELRVQSREGMDIVTVRCRFELADADVQVVFDAADRLAGLSIRPVLSTVLYAPPDYVHPPLFRDQQTVVDAGGWPLPGTLTVPVGPGPFPAVVLVHGSGPGDRDETFGPNRIFRDLAEGLASRGLAVLRYEKRTKEHGERIAASRKFTPNEETIDDAVAAVAVLRGTPRVDPARIYVLGHSFGGMLAPRIAQAEPRIAGLVVLAGAVRPLEQSLLDQTRYLAEYDGKVDAGERAQLDTLVELSRRVTELKPSDPPVAFAGTSAPAAYWLALRGYDPPAVAATLPQSWLVLQGERDYQVTTADFARWRQALTGREDCRFHSYPALNHMFIAGVGRSHPGEYGRPGHVAAQVIDDIAAWVAADSPRRASPGMAR